MQQNSLSFAESGVRSVHTATPSERSISEITSMKIAAAPAETV